MSRVTAGTDNIKVSVVCLRLSHAQAGCTVIMADRTTDYTVISMVPPVIVCCINGIFLLNFSPFLKILLFSFQLASQMHRNWGKGASCTPSSFALLPLAWYFGRWCDFAGWQWPWQGWSRTFLVLSSLEMSRGCAYICVCWGARRGSV